MFGETVVNLQRASADVTAAVSLLVDNGREMMSRASAELAAALAHPGLSTRSQLTILTNALRDEGPRSKYAARMVASAIAALPDVSPGEKWEALVKAGVQLEQTARPDNADANFAAVMEAYMAAGPLAGGGSGRYLEEAMERISVRAPGGLPELPARTPFRMSMNADAEHRHEFAGHLRTKLSFPGIYLGMRSDLIQVLAAADASPSEKLRGMMSAVDDMSNKSDSKRLLAYEVVASMRDSNPHEVWTELMRRAGESEQTAPARAQAAYQVAAALESRNPALGSAATESLNRLQSAPSSTPPLAAASGAGGQAARQFPAAAPPVVTATAPGPAMSFGGRGT